MYCLASILYPRLLRLEEVFIAVTCAQTARALVPEYMDLSLLHFPRANALLKRS